MNYAKIYDCFLAKYKKQTFLETEKYEIHHIIPKHMGGSNDPSNLIKLTSRQHRFAHGCLYKIYGSRWDKAVWKYLLNKHEEALFLLRSEAGKKGGKIAGNKNVQSGHINKFLQAAWSARKKNGTSPVLIEQMRRWAIKHWSDPDFKQKSIDNLKIGLAKKVELDKEAFLEAMASAPRDEKWLDFKSKRSKYKIISHEKIIFDSNLAASKYYGVSPHSVDNWAKRNQYGWTRVLKTDE